jgi:ASPM-SPD-2-Hydin domain-containing protein
MNFGSVAVGSSSTAKKGTLTAGSSDVHVSTVDQTGQGYTLSGISFPVTVPAGKSISFSVTFSPTASGSAPGSLSFMSDATNSPAAETLSGSGGTAGTQQHSVTLSWSASTSSVQGYNIYRGTASGGPYAQLNSSPQPSTSYTDSDVQPSTTYFYVATAVDSNSVESGFSNETTAVVP